MFPKLQVRDELPLLIPEGGVAVELGVARGDFSEVILKNSKAGEVYSIDRWGGDRGHGSAEYRSVVQRLAPYNKTCVRSVIMREEFDKARLNFPKGHFDFIYIDGYAHQGQEGGKTLVDWWDLLKPGGVFAGHDYAKDFPLTVQAVDAFMLRRCLMYATTKEKVNAATVTYPSWYTIKPK
ncbi:MAG: class I SAM-dependent methyltransferase [Patescibacteria group bacterium]|jgi:SAM-dependent methyltransferase